MQKFKSEIGAAFRAVKKASFFVRHIQNQLIKSEDVLSKNDKSPVTIADFGAQAILVHELTKQFSYPFISEETSDSLAEQNELTAKLHLSLKDYLQFNSEEDEITQLLRIIDEGSSKLTRDDDNKSGRWWTIDPIDGTLGFLRNGQYAVALALLEDNEPVVGVLGCPSLPLSLHHPNSKIGCIFVGIKGEGSFQFLLDDGDDDVDDDFEIDFTRATKISVNNEEAANSSQLTLIQSVESSHSSHELNTRLCDKIGITGDIKMDSQVKYAVIARGDASVYLRLSSVKYREKIWDHAAGSLIVLEANGVVTDYHGNTLDFSHGKHLSQNQGIIATSKVLYDRVKQGVDEVDPISLLSKQIN